jgi:GNAT superfamily N-acetyltransferase
MKDWIIRRGRREDCQAVYELICALARYEREPEAVVVSAEQLAEHGFGQDPVYELFVAEREADKEVFGMALFYTKYSTWKGPCLYLEDLMVDPTGRRTGAGRALFDAVAREAANRGCLRMEWQVLEWNESALGFYRHLGAELDAEWLNGRLSGTALASYARKA